MGSDEERIGDDGLLEPPACNEVGMTSRAGEDGRAVNGTGNGDVEISSFGSIGVGE